MIGFSHSVSQSGMYSFLDVFLSFVLLLPFALYSHNLHRFLDLVIFPPGLFCFTESQRKSKQSIQAFLEKLLQPHSLPLSGRQRNLSQYQFRNFKTNVICNFWFSSNKQEADQTIGSKTIPKNHYYTSSSKTCVDS